MSDLTHSTNPHGRGRAWTRPVSRHHLAGGLALIVASVASGQEALRNSLTEQSVVEAQRQQWENQPYNIKAGDLKMLIVPSIGLDYNDNIYISSSNPQSDWILKPFVDFDGVYPFTEHNVLSLSVGVGYDEYLQHDRRSDWRLKSDSGLSFDVQVQDFQFNLHDRFSYSQDPTSYSALANIPEYGRFNNTAGISTIWDLGDVVPSLSYDHQNSIVTTKDFEYEDCSTEMLVGRVGFQIHPKVTTGVESTAAFTTYDKKILNDNDNYSVGGYVDWKPGAYFQLSPRVGYSTYVFQHTSRYGETADMNSWYADLKVTHKISDMFSYSIDAGRETRLGVQSDVVQSWFLRPSLNWTGFHNFNTTAYLTFENATTQGQNYFRSNFSEKYDYLGAGFNLSYPIMKKLSASLHYRITVRFSNSANRDYTQNVVGIQLAYRL